MLEYLGRAHSTQGPATTGFRLPVDSRREIRVSGHISQEVCRQTHRSPTSCRETPASVLFYGPAERGRQGPPPMKKKTSIGSFMRNGVAVDAAMVRAFNPA